MADPSIPPKHNPSFFLASLADQNSIPRIPDAFFHAHLEHKKELVKLKLTSDAFERTWEVKLNGRSFAGGWEDFSAAHCLKDDDVLIFRHHGDMTFHVTPSGRSFSKILCISSSSDDSDDDDDDDDSEDDDDDSDNDSEDDDDEDDDDDETWDNGSDSKNILSKEKSRLKAESSSSENSCFLAPTPSNLRQDRVSLTKRFSRTNALNKRWCVIDLMNQRGKSWALGLRHNKVTGQDYILGGWRSFCRANELKTGIFYRFELVRNGARPLLQLCSDITSQGNCSKANRKAKVSAKSSREDESASLTVTLKPYMLKSRQLRLSSDFSRKNGIKKEGEITLVDKNGVKWPSYVVCVQGRLYITKGVIDFWAANQIETGETFTLELVRGEGTTPMLKFCSKAKVQEETETRFQKRARVSSEGGPSRCTQASNKSTAAPKNLECKQPLQPCSFSDQLTKVKQCSVGIITDVRRFRSELEIKEQNLEALLQELSALGEKVLEINKIIK
ncbi:hypothetical protein EUTSA_v10027046mg [Eutrema salsugineum]|uniref:TF-B3 domain-containing protein n=1 Tax=Eutrema salsugineum TaxID=72664 RepID=V4MMK7_EUTSA|nr:hypothetical protein EUTSA_v10027046mg [Eutrema salsugineum]